MKRILSAGIAAVALSGASAFAADLPVKAPYLKAPLAPVYNWNGFYVGANTGVAVSQSRFGDVSDRSDLGFAGGVQAGFNWQFAPQWVAGLEGDIGYLGTNRSFRDFGTPVAQGLKTDWYGTIRGRFGYANGPSLFYTTGGAAFVNVKNNFDLPSSAFFSSNSNLASGWTAGGGIETQLGGNWSAKAEYLYIDAGDNDFFVVSPLGNAIVPFDNRFHVYRYGVNYKFGASAAPIQVAHNWTGFYAGINAGTGVSQSSFNAPFNGDAGTSADISDTGFAGGGQAGYNWQFSPNWVGGVEGDIGYLGIRRSFISANRIFGVDTDWYGTLRGRLGYSTGPALLYVTGGAAFVNVKNNVDRDGLVFASKTETAAGWALGGGIESTLAQNWTAKTEYLYIDAGDQDVVNTNVIPDGNNTAHFDNRFHVFRFGLNYNFGG